MNQCVSLMQTFELHNANFSNELKLYVNSVDSMPKVDSLLSLNLSEFENI